MNNVLQEEIIKCKCGLYCGTIKDWSSHNEATHCGSYTKSTVIEALNENLKDISKLKYWRKALADKATELLPRIDAMIERNTKGG